MTQPLRLTRSPAARRRAIIAICLVFLVLIVCVFSAVLAYTRSDRFREAQENTALYALQVARNLNFVVQTANLILENSEPAASRLLESAPDAARDRDELDRLKKLQARWPFLLGLEIVAKDGSVRVGTATDPLRAALAHDYRETGSEPHPTEQLLLGTHSRDAGSSILLIHPLPAAGGGEAGALLAAINVRYIVSVYREMHLPVGSVLTVFRGDDLTPLVSEPSLFQDSQAIVQDTAELRRALVSGQSGTLTESSMADGSTQILSFQKLAYDGLYAGVSLPRSAVRQFWRGDVYTAGSLAALAAVALMTITFSVLHHTRMEQQAKDHLEERVRERTIELETLNRQLETLFREVHHRVKNNLQIVTSLLSLQAARLPPGPAGDALQDSINRIYSMSLVHEMLYSERETTSIDYSVYLGTLAGRIADAFETKDRVAVEVTGERLILDLNSAIPLALISSEVISNAMKHAFPDDRRGRLSIEIATDPSVITLAIKDDGVGHDWKHWEKGDGVGLKILYALTRQIGAEAAFENRNGTWFRLQFPRAQSAGIA